MKLFVFIRQWNSVVLRVDSQCVVVCVPSDSLRDAFAAWRVDLSLGDAGSQGQESIKYRSHQFTVDHRRYLQQVLQLRQTDRQTRQQRAINNRSMVDDGVDWQMTRAESVHSTQQRQQQQVDMSNYIQAGFEQTAPPPPPSLCFTAMSRTGLLPSRRSASVLHRWPRSGRSRAVFLTG